MRILRHLIGKLRRDPSVKPLPWSPRVTGVLGLYSLAALAKFVLLLAVAGLAALGFRRIGTQPERWWLLEAAVLAVALVVAGLLVSLPPPA